MIMLSALPHTLVLCIFASLVGSEQPIPASQQHLARQYTPLNDLNAVSLLSPIVEGPDVLDFRDPDSFLSRILIPRPAGSENLNKVRKMLKDRFNELESSWDLEEDCFTATTPIGERPMCNLAFTHDAEADRRLVIAAHIDSKWFPSPPQSDFVGATDSAASVALMIDLADRLTPWLDGRSKSSSDRITLTLLFLDGEEAFHDWTATDSIYGAKHLAEKWQQPFRPPSPARSISNGLQRITTFVLLDLIGAANPSMQNFYHQTGWLYDRFYESEKRLKEAGLLYVGVALSEQVGKGSIFRSRDDPRGMWYGRIEDDHLPFVARGVPVLHLIAVPFPSVWHTLRDDATALDFATLKAWSVILRTVAAEYLSLGPPSGVPAKEL